MFEFEPSVIDLLAQWLTNYGLAFGAGLIVGSVATLCVFIVKITRLRRGGATDKNLLVECARLGENACKRL